MRNRALFAIALAGAAGLWIGGLFASQSPRSALGAEAVGSVAGWVYWTYCPAYGYGVAAPGQVEGSRPGGNGTTAAPDGRPPSGGAPAGPIVIYPERQPAPAAGAVVALQGTSLSTRADEEGFFMIEDVPVGVYYTVAASLPRRRAMTQAETSRPVRPEIAPMVCATGSSMRGNVVATDPIRPTNIGALMVGRFAPGPRPLAPGQSAAEDDSEGEIEP